MTRSSAASRSGYTLVEILTASTLALLVLGMATAFLLPGLRAFARGSVRAEMQQAGLVALTTLTDDLRTSAGGTVTARSDPTAIGLTRAAGISPDGKVLWDPRVVVYYHDRTNRNVIRKTWPPEPPSLSTPPPTESAPVALTAQQLSAILAVSNGTEHRIASNVDTLTLDGAGGPGTTRSPVTIRMNLSRDGPSGLEVASVSATVALRERW